MLAYFPTEQLYYLRVHDIIPAAITLPILGKTVSLNAKKLLLASSRFYLAYIFLEFFKLKEQAGLLYAKQKALDKVNNNSTEANAEKAELKNSLKAHRLATAYNALRLPGTLQWSLESGIPLSDVTGAVLGLGAAGITWVSHGIVPPPPPPPGGKERDGPEEKEARAVVKEVGPYTVEPDTDISRSTSSFVEVKETQA